MFRKILLTTTTTITTTTTNNNNKYNKCVCVRACVCVDGYLFVFFADFRRLISFQMLALEYLLYLVFADHHFEPCVIDVVAFSLLRVVVL